MAAEFIPAIKAAEAPELPVNSITVQPIELENAPNTEGGLSYTGEDGTEYHVKNIDDAIKLCPVLGKIAVESPDKAKAVALMAIAGNKLMSEQSKNKPPVKAAPKSEPKLKVKSDASKNSEKNNKAEVTPTAAAETQAPRIQSEQVLLRTKEAEIHQEPVKVSTRTTKVQPPEAKKTEPNAEPAFSEQHAVQKDLIPKNLNTLLTKQVAKINASIAQENLELDTNHTAAPFKEPKPSMPTEYETQATLAAEKLPAVDLLTEITYEGKLKTIAVDLEELSETAITLPINRPETDEDNISKPSKLDKTTPLYEHDEIQEIKLEDSSSEETLGNQKEKTFHPKTVETYYLLLALPDGEPHKQNLAARTEVPIVPSPFEDFIEIQNTAERPQNIEEIREQAETTPLENTLAKLANYLSEKIPENPDIKESQELLVVNILNELQALLPADTDESGKNLQETELTLEMTDKILELLEELGYKNPEQELVQFVSKYGRQNLIQTMVYLCQVKNSNLWQENLIFSAPSLANKDDGIERRFARFVLDIVNDKDRPVLVY